MPELQGKVLYIKIGDDIGVAKIREDGTGEEEVCPIWAYLSGDPKPPTYKRTIHTMQISLLTEALVNNLSVVIYWDQSTGMPINIRLLAAP
jgi:hypothetical protein